MILSRSHKAGLILVALALVVTPGSARSQAAKGAPEVNTGVPNALQGFSQNKEQPVQIEAQQLDVRDKDKVAIFSGNVVVTQGDTIMKCKSLHVFYDQDDAKGAGAGKSKGMKAAKPGPGGKQTIKRLEARGGVLVIQKEQTATGETGIFEMKTNTITLIGGKDGVVINQGTNLLRGERLVVDLNTSFARVESGKGRVQGIFSTNKEPGKDDKPGDKPSGAGQSKDGQKPAAKKPAASVPSGSPFPSPLGPPRAEN